MDFNLDTDPFTKTPLLEFVTNCVSDILLANKGLNNELIESKLASEKYIWAITHVFAEILETIEDLELIKVQLLDLMPPHHEYFNDKNPAHNVRYHIENYIIRVYKVKDQILQLIKTILDIPVKNNLQLEKAVFKYLTVHKVTLVDYWHLMHQTFDAIKPYRNYIAHRSSLRYSDLSTVSVYFKYAKDDDKDNYYNFIEPMQKEIIDKTVTTLDTYLKNIDTLLKITCITLLSAFSDTYKRLIAEERNVAL